MEWFESTGVTVDWPTEERLAKQEGDVMEVVVDGTVIGKLDTDDEVVAVRGLLAAAVTRCLSTGEAARVLRISQGAVLRLVERGELQAVSTVLGRFFVASEVEVLAETRERRLAETERRRADAVERRIRAATRQSRKVEIEAPGAPVHLLTARKWTRRTTTAAVSQTATERALAAWHPAASTLSMED